ncbi:hypothetical protein acdb102_49280 [Acidothermaceae bacterium B102]|nr:hypothetical protein acdb102_49280 [Acidothermaceae bacterium B102]
MRISRWIAAATVAVVGVGVAPLAGASAASSSSHLKHVSAAIAPATVYIGDRAVVSGTVSPKVAGATVVLQRFESGHWRALAHVKTVKGGRYSLAVRAPKKAALWPLRVVGTGATGPTLHLRISKTEFVVHSKVTAAVSAGAPTVVTGTVTPKAAGRVQLQALTAGAWQTVANVALVKGSAFTFRLAEPAGTHRLRVVRLFTATIAGGISKAATVTVAAPVPGGGPTTPPGAPTTTPPPATPTVSITLAGTTTALGSYLGSVTVTITAAAAAGVHAITYTLDGGAATAYSGPVTVTSAASHTLIATATDANGLIATATSYWTQHAATTSLTDDFTTGGTVSPSCLVTGFDGVLPNTGGTQCKAANITFVSSGLALTSTAGQLANGNQQNALYKSFDATNGNFSVTTRVVSGVGQISTNYQQIGAFFGPDTTHFVKVEAEHNGAGNPHLTMYLRDDNFNNTVATVTPTGLAAAHTLDLTIKSTNGQLTVYYSINGAALTQVGTAKTPLTPGNWFTSAAKAGIEVSNTGSTTPITATFSSFGITGR